MKHPTHLRFEIDDVCRGPMVSSFQVPSVTRVLIEAAIAAHGRTLEWPPRADLGARAAPAGLHSAGRRGPDLCRTPSRPPRPRMSRRVCCLLVLACAAALCRAAVPSPASSGSSGSSGSGPRQQPAAGQAEKPSGPKQDALFGDGSTAPSSVLMITMGGTRSHKVPFMALGRALVQKGHNVSFISAFPPARDTPEEPGFEEVTPLGLVLYIRNYTDWDLVGARFRGEEPVPWDQALAYTYETCDAMLSDPETQQFLHSGRHFDLLILDGAYPECAVGLAHHFNAPFMYINTVGFHLASVSTAGSPVPYATTPFLSRSFTDKMTLLQRAENSLYHTLFFFFNNWLMTPLVQNVLNKHFPDVPTIAKLTSNVSFILQNAHHTVSYSRPYLPNVAEIACIHCREARPLSKELDEFVRGGKGNGFIFVSMGSSVRATNMPELLRLLFLRVFAQLPYQVLWKWEFGSESMPDLPPNVRLERWLPQQDLLGHPKIVAFLTHGGLLSMFETVYHGVPVVTLPVFCDHDANSAKAQDDGYAIQLELQQLTADDLLTSLKAVIQDPKYRAAAKHRQTILRDQRQSPLETAVYWTEYVLRHRGAEHLQAPVRHMPFYQWALLDVIAVYALLVYVTFKVVKIMASFAYRCIITPPPPVATKKSVTNPVALANGIANGLANGKKRD